MRHYDKDFDEAPLLPKNRENEQTHAVKLALPKSNHATMRRTKLVIILTSFAIVGCFLVVAHILSISPEFSQYKLLRDYQKQIDNEVVPKKLRHARTMLLWTSFFEDARWSLKEDTVGVDYFRDVLHCPEYHCEVTNNRDFLPAIEMYDAVLFHTAEPFSIMHPVPSKRSTHQQYVFALMESPGETKHILSDEGGFYNLTMSYRLDSDVLWPYMFVEDIETGDIVAPAIRAKWRQVPDEWNDTSIEQLWKGKTRMAAWFVSHCDTLSKREKLAEALQEHIDVDIYGKCGNYSCPRSNANKCNELLDERYKFYFAFENSLCNDYVTEKLYNAMKRDVIPVVFGGADYSRFVPPHSVIDAQRFESAAHLASHLRYVATHPEEYMRYFWWRRYYRLTYRSPFCDLCEKLHSVTYTQKTQSYLNIQKWWMANQCSFKAKIKFT